MRFHCIGCFSPSYNEEAIHAVRLFVNNGDKKATPMRELRETVSHLDAVNSGDEMLHVPLNLEETLPNKDPNQRLHSTRLRIPYWTQDDKVDSSGKTYKGAYIGDFTNFNPWFVSMSSTNANRPSRVCKKDASTQQRNSLNNLSKAERELAAWKIDTPLKRLTTSVLSKS